MSEEAATRDGPPKPAPPRRFKTAYILFSESRYKLIRQNLIKQGAHKKTTQITEMIAADWRNMTAAEKETFEAESRKDRARYEAEKALYMASKGKSRDYRSKRILKDESAPKRPVSAYFLFANGRRAGAKKEHPDATNTELSRILSKMWKSASAEAKAEYEAIAERSQAEYKVALAAWKKSKNAKSKAKRRKQQPEAGSRMKKTRSGGQQRPEEANVTPEDPAATTTGSQRSISLSSMPMGGEPLMGTSITSAPLSTTISVQQAAEKDGRQPTVSSSARHWAGYSHDSHARTNLTAPTETGTGRPETRQAATTPTGLGAGTSDSMLQPTNSTGIRDGVRLSSLQQSLLGLALPSPSLPEEELSLSGLFQGGSGLVFRDQQHVGQLSQLRALLAYEQLQQCNAGMTGVPSTTFPQQIGAANAAGLLETANPVELQQVRQLHQAGLLGLGSLAGRGPSIDLSHHTALTQLQQQPLLSNQLAPLGTALDQQNEVFLQQLLGLLQNASTNRRNSLPPGPN